MIDKLRYIQQNLKAPKNQKNTFGGYNYRSCEDIFEAVKPLLEEQKLTLQLSDELVQIGERYYIKATAILKDDKESIENTAYAREEETKKGMDGSQITGASSSYARKYALNGLFLIDDVKDSDSTNQGEEKGPTIEEAQKWTFPIGKYKGKTIDEVINDEDDEQYVDWFMGSKANDYDKKCYSLLTGEVMPTEEEQKEMLELLTKFEKLVIATNTKKEELYDYYKVKNNTEMTKEQFKDAIKLLELKKTKIETEVVI